MKTITMLTCWVCLASCARATMSDFPDDHPIAPKGVPHSTPKTDTMTGVDFCFSEYRYSDGHCDRDCVYIDRDCNVSAECDADPLSQDGEDCNQWVSQRPLLPDELRFCANLTADPRPIQETAHSICIRHWGQDLVDCIANCVNEYFKTSGTSTDTPSF